MNAVHPQSLLIRALRRIKEASQPKFHPPLPVFRSFLTQSDFLLESLLWIKHNTEMICVKHTGRIVIDYLGMEELTEKSSALFLSLPRLSGHLWGGLSRKTNIEYL